MRIKLFWILFILPTISYSQVTDSFCGYITRIDTALFPDQTFLVIIDTGSFETRKVVIQTAEYNWLDTVELGIHLFNLKLKRLNSVKTDGQHHFKTGIGTSLVIDREIIFDFHESAYTMEKMEFVGVRNFSKKKKAANKK